MAVGNFLWGAGGEQLTPQQVARQREIAGLLAQRGSDTSPVGHWTQGAARVVEALGGVLRNRRADAAEEAGREGATNAISDNPVLAALMGGSTSGPQPAIMSSDGMGGGAFPASLIQSESGGNWGALNNEGYGGRLQFGEARLADAARAGIIPAGLTGADFSRMSPEQQQAVEAWHFADIDRQAAQMGLDQYIGQEVAGIPITQDGIRAMAHLGGIGGAARFLQSGGQQNPADSNGTSLADYARAHGGGVGASYAAPNQAVVSALMGASADPWVQEAYGPQIAALLGQQMDMQGAAYQQQLAQQDPMYQAQLDAMLMQNDALRNPAPVIPEAPETQVFFDEATGQEYRAQWNGLTGQWERVGGISNPSGPLVSVDLGQNKFDEAFAANDADTLAQIGAAGMTAQRNLGRIDQLEGLLAAAPSGASGMFAQMAGNMGISVPGADEVQAAQALINSLVPEQRPPGSGPMSDADLELFKQSLPRIVNQPGGNAQIIQAMRGIAQYDAEGAAIIQRLRNEEISQAEAFSLLQNRINPLANFTAPSASAGAGQSQTPPAATAAVDYSTMSPDQLMQMDLGAMNETELSAWMAATEGL